jgi:hypothetical protein
MKSLEIFEAGDSFRVKSTGAIRTCWKVSTAILYVDSEGNPFMAEDVEPIKCQHLGATKLPLFQGVWDCPGCGIYFEGEDDSFLEETLGFPSIRTERND